VEPAPCKTRVVKFGVFEVDLEAGELRKSGVRQKLVGQPFQILQFFLEHPQEIVTREQLQKRIWPGETVVDYDLALKKAVNRIREILGDSAESPRFIETIPRRGYRFIAPLDGQGNTGAVAVLPIQAAPPISRRPGFSFRPGPFFGFGATALLVAILVLMPSESWRRLSGKPAAPQIHSLAVLPLQNLSSDPAQEFFSDGMTDALITDLAQMGSVRVISRTSSMVYKKSNKPLREIAHELNVDGIIEGTVQRSGDRVRITAQLIHAPQDQHLWAKSYERDLHDVLTLERDVTDDIARQVQAQITTRGHSPVQPRPLDPKVLEAYLQGNYHMNIADTRGGDEERRMAGGFFQRAIDADPTFVPAYIGLAGAHRNLWNPSSEDFAIMKTSAAKALQLDPTSSDAHWAVGMTKWEDWDWKGAEEETRRAIELNPNNIAAHDQLQGILCETGQTDEALKEAEITQQLDPHQDHISGALSQRGDYSRAIELLLTTAEAHPDNAIIHYCLFEAYAQNGMHADSVQELGKTMTLLGFPEVAERLSRSFATSGWTGALQQWAKELEQLMAIKHAYFPVLLAQTYVRLGENDRAFYWLEWAVEHRHLAIADPIMQDVKVDPSLAPLHSDPRFKILLRRMGLPE
jgi:TolB-like protein/DNA-binding winged helix-turn-helix (wHTH) protein